MTSSDQDKGHPSNEDRVEKIKEEEKEDPTTYYTQGDSKDSFNEELEFSKPVPPVEKTREEMSLLKAVAYLGFGLAALAIIFILFFIRDLDDRVGGVDSAVNSLEEKIAPLKKEVRDSLNKVNEDITGLKAKMDDSESRLAVMELKRALLAIQSMELSDSPEAMAKSSQVITSIESLMDEFGTGESPALLPAKQIPAGEVKVEEAPAIELPDIKPVAEEHVPTVEEHAQEPAAEAASESEPTPEIEEISEEEGTDKEEDADEEEGAEDDDEEDDEEKEDG